MTDLQSDLCRSNRRVEAYRVLEHFAGCRTCGSVANKFQFGYTRSPVTTGMRARHFREFEYLFLVEWI